MTPSTRPEPLLARLARATLAVALAAGLSLAPPAASDAHGLAPVASAYAGHEGMESGAHGHSHDAGDAAAQAAAYPRDGDPGHDHDHGPGGHGHEPGHGVDAAPLRPPLTRAARRAGTARRPQGRAPPAPRRPPRPTRC